MFETNTHYTHSHGNDHRYPKIAKNRNKTKNKNPKKKKKWMTQVGKGKCSINKRKRSIKLPRRTHEKSLRTVSKTTINTKKIKKMKT